MTIYSKVSSKAQTVIPKEVRKQLGLKPGDLIRYKLKDGSVEIERAGETVEDPFGVFTEWASDADEKAYGKL